MANYQNLLDSIAAVIRTNGNNEITGAVLQSTLQSMVSVLGANATYGGVATPTTNPGTPDGGVFYLAIGGGVYPNFSGINVADNEFVVLLWNGENWVKELVADVALYSDIEQLMADISFIGGYNDSDITFINTQLESGIKGVAKIQKIKGNTIVWNQLTYGHFVNNVNNPWVIYNSTKISCADGILKISPNTAGKNCRIYRSLTTTASHKYLCRYKIRLNTTAATQVLATWGYFNGTTKNIERSTKTTNTWHTINAVVEPVNATQVHIGYYLGDTTIQTTDSVEVADINIFDLTVMFGAGNEPTASEFLSYYPLDYYEPTTNNTIKVVSPTSLTSSLNAKSSVLQLTNYNLAAVGSTRDELDLINGTLTRRTGERTYQSGDESDTNVITDGTNTIYILDEATVENVDDKNTIMLYDGGSLSYGSNDIIAPVPTTIRTGNDVSELIQHGESAYQDCQLYERLITNADLELTPTADKYANYSTGSIASAGASTHMEMYAVPLDGILLLDVYVGSGDAVPAAIAFYNSSVFTVNTYMQEPSVQAIAGAHWYKVSIPQGATYAVVSNKTTTVPSPVINVTRADAIQTPIISSALNQGNAQAYQHTPFLNKVWYAHHAPIGFLNDGNNHKMIAGESLASIRLAARLGFKYIEANIQKTADNQYICIHGVGTGFGSMCISLDGQDPSSMVIGEKTLSYIQTNIRYDSYYDKYKTTIPTLEEFLAECKANGIGIVASGYYDDAINMCINTLGKDGVLLYLSSVKPIIDGFTGLVFYYNNESTKSASDYIQIAEGYRRPYCINLGPSAISHLETIGEIDDFVSGMHSRGYMCGFAYLSEEKSAEMIRKGFDMAASDHQVNEVNAGLVYDINNPTNITSSATITNGTVSLPINGTLSCGDTSVMALGKGMIRIRYNGELTFNFGAIGSRTIASDGTYTLNLSDLFLMRKPQLQITATAATDITEFIYIVEEC